MSRQKITREKFMRLGAILTLAPAGAAALASCGGGSSNGGGETDSAQTPQQTTQAAAPEETTAEETAARGSSSAEDAIAAESEVPPGSAVEFEDGGRPAVLVRLESGEFVAYSAVCTHQGCAVAYDEDSSRLACPCHGSAFDPANGASVVNGPATSPLAEIPVSVEGGSVARA